MEIQTSNLESHLLERAIKRDKIAFADLYDRYLNRVYKYVYYWLPNRADAEDITQDVFVKAWRSIDKYKITEVPFIAWLNTIARNSIISHHRATKRLVPLPDMDFTANHNDNPERIAEVNFGNDNIRGAILKLKGEKQKVIHMRFIGDMSYEEIAKALNKTEGAIRVIQYRALRDLRQILEKENR